MELSTIDWNMLNENVIHLTSSNLNGGKMHCTNVLWDDNIYSHQKNKKADVK